MAYVDASGTAPVDGEASAGTYHPFTHLTTENCALYRQAMGVFVRAKQEFTVHLRPEDVHLGLPPETRPPLEAVAVALERLGRWGNLRADPDTSRVTALEDFYRARHIYQLTRAGEAAEEALAAYDEALGRRGELQAVALADITVQLRALLALTGRPGPDPAVVHLALLSLVDRFSGLADNARAFMGSLQRTVDLHEAEVDVFLAYKQRLIEYLERFIEDLVIRGAEIAGLLEDLGTAPDGPIGPLVRLAAGREAADAAPDAAAEALAEAERRWYGRWDGLRTWFLSVPGRSSQAKLLRSAARQAVPQLLGVVQALNERRAGRSDRSADFRELARWFAEAPDDDSRHRLWRSAFGMHSARHLTIDQEALAEREADPVPACRVLVRRSGRADQPAAAAHRLVRAARPCPGRPGPRRGQGVPRGAGPQAGRADGRGPCPSGHPGCGTAQRAGRAGPGRLPAVPAAPRGRPVGVAARGGVGHRHDERRNDGNQADAATRRGNRRDPNARRGAARAGAPGRDHRPGHGRRVRGRGQARGPPRTHR